MIASMKRLILYCLIFLASLEAGAQVVQFSQPIKLGTEINSDDEELAPMLSPDGQTLYFSRAFHGKNTGGKYAGTDIWISRKDANGNWTPAVKAGDLWNNKRSNAVIGISHDGATVYLLNAYNNKSGISFSRLVNGKWTAPEFIPVPGINRDDFVSVYVHPSFDVMLISMKGRGSYGEEDLYVSLRDSLGNWNQPRNLGPSINTSGFESSPFLSADKRRLYFSSNGHPGFGDADIFYSDRLYDSWETWTTPRNLGDHINSEQFDAYFSYHSDSSITFISNRNGSSVDIFMTKVDSKNIVKDDLSEVAYITDAEVKKIFGEHFPLSVKFEKNSSVLNAQQSNQILQVAQKLNTNTDLKVHLVTRRGQNSVLLEVSKERLNVILEELRKSGVEGSRITFGSEIVQWPAEEDDRIVFLKFYR